MLSSIALMALKLVLISALPTTDARYLRQIVVCQRDVQTCPGGTFVGRDPNDGCRFELCPPWMPSVQLQCFSQRRQKFMDEGTTFRNCRLPSGNVASKCVCEAGHWVDAGTVVTPLPGPGPQCYRRSTKSFVSFGTSVPCIRPKGKTCTCGSNGKWLVTGGYSSRRRRRSGRGSGGSGGRGGRGGNGGNGGRGGSGKSTVDTKCQPVCDNGRNDACMHTCAQCVAKYGFVCPYAGTCWHNGKLMQDGDWDGSGLCKCSSGHVMCK